MIFPAWMTYTMEHDVMRFAQVAVRVWGCEMNFEHPEITAKAGIDALKAFWGSLGMPLNFEQLGAKEEDIPKLLETLQIEDHTEGSFVLLDKDACEAIYHLACK